MIYIMEQVHVLLIELFINMNETISIAMFAFNRSVSPVELQYRDFETIIKYTIQLKII